MAKQPEPLAVAPNMPATSIDFNALHDAVSKGKTAEEAVAAADLTPPVVAAPEPAPEPEVPVADDAA